MMTTSTPDNLLAQANQLRDNGKLDQACTLLAQLIDQEPQNPEPHRVLGHIAYKSGNYGQAKEHYSQALELEPTHLDTLVHLGNSYRQLDLGYHATSYYQKALTIAPNFWPAQDRLTRMYANITSVYALKLHTEQALKLQPNHPEFTNYHKKASRACAVDDIQPRWLQFLRLPELYLKNPKYFTYKHNRENFTFVIQGPLHSNSINHITTYLKWGKVVVSYWEGDNETLLVNLPSEVTTVKQPLPQKEDVPFNPGMAYYIAKSTAHGLQDVTTPYAIKLRSDEAYSHWQLFCFLLQQTPDKYLTHNLWFRPVSMYPFHPSDHVIGMDTQRLLKTYQRVLNFCERPHAYRITPHIEKGFIQLDPNSSQLTKIHCESLTAIAFLQEKGYPPTPDNALTLTQQHFRIHPLALFRKFYWCSGGLRIKNSQDPFPVNSVAYLNQLSL